MAVATTNGLLDWCSVVIGPRKYTCRYTPGHYWRVRTRSQDGKPGLKPVLH